jgi:pyruvate/2-oxoacid:ferredoxin oxidoreductase beta subunit
MSAIAAPPVTAEPGQLTKETYRGRIHPDWCPGCGDFSVLAALQTALFELSLHPHQACVISGIGCSSNLPVTSIPMACTLCMERFGGRDWR